MIQGVVKFYNSQKKLGYIKRNDGKRDVHIGEDSFNGVYPIEGDKVEFETINDKKPHAIKLNVIDGMKNIFLDYVLDTGKADYDEFCEYTLKYAEELKKGKLTTSMIRKVYSKIMNANITKLKMLRPQFAYTAGRNDDKAGVKDFMNLLDFLAKSIKNGNQLKNLKRFMEAVVAYRKYVGDDK